MADKIKIRRGNFINLPDLDSGEFGLSVDTGTLYVGTPDHNILINPVLENEDGYSIDGYLIPAVDNVHWLGTPDSRWHSVYVGPGTINIVARDSDPGYTNLEYRIGIDSASGNLQFVGSNDTVLIDLSADGGVTFPNGGSLSVDPAFAATVDEHYTQHSNDIQTIIKSITYDGYVTIPDLGATGDGYVTFYTGIGSNVAGSGDLYWDREFKRLKVGGINNLSLYHDGTDGFLDVSTGNININGSIIPITTNVYSLGNSSFGWSSIYANTAFYLNTLGSVGTPAYSFTNDSNTGMYSAGTDQLNFSTGGSLRMTIGTVNTVSTLNVIPTADNTLTLGSSTNGWSTIHASTAFRSNAIGSATTPAFSFTTDTNTGIYSAGGDNLNFSTNSTVRLSITTTQITPALSFVPSVSNTFTLGASGTGWSTIHASTAFRSNTLGVAGAPAYSFDTDSNTGMYSIGADNLTFSTGSTQKLNISTTTISPSLDIIPTAGNSFDLGSSGSPWANVIFATAALSAVSGSAAAPPFSFTANSTTGMYIAGSNTIGFSTSSTLRLSISTTTIVPTLSIVPTADNTLTSGSAAAGWSTVHASTAFRSNTLGSAGAPAFSFTNDSNTGMYSATADNLNFSTNSTVRLSITTTQITPALSFVPSANNSFTLGASGTGWSTIHAATAFRSNTLGSAGTPAYSFDADTNTGIYSAGGDNLNFSTNSTARLSITTTQINPTLSIIPTVDDSIDLGSSTLRFRDIFLGPTSLHILSTAAETGTAREYILNIQETVGADRGYLRLFEGATQLMTVKPVDGYVGIGTTTPLNKLDVFGGVLIGSGLAGTVEAPADGLRVQGNVIFDKMQHYVSAYRTVDSTATAGSFSALGSTNGGTVLTYVTQGISFNTTTGIATISENGLYSIEAFLLVTQSASGAMDDFSLLLNGTDTIWLSQPYVTSTASPVSIHAGFYYALTSGETLQVRVDGNGANTIVVENGSTFNIRRIS